MRTEIKDRYYRTYTYQDVDRAPDIEFGYWPQTIRRWLKEGLPPMRPLFFDFPEDKGCISIDDEFLFGPDILVAPVLQI